MFDLVETYAEEDRKNVSTSQNVEFKIDITKRHTVPSSVFVPPATGTRLYKNAPLRSVHSKETFQQFCTVSNRRKKTRWRESK